MSLTLWLMIKRKTKSVSRLGVEVKDGKKVRIFKKTGKEY